MQTEEVQGQVASIGLVVQQDAVIKKPVNLVVMKPASGVSVTLAARKIYNALLAQAQIEMMRKGGPILSTETFSIHLSTALKTVGLESANFNTCKQYVEELEDWKVIWESPNAGAKQTRDAIRMLAQSKLVKKDGQVNLHFAFPPYVNQLLWEACENKEYALIMLRVISVLTTFTSLALYEICAKFRGIPQTSRKPPEWWQDALLNKGLAPDEKRREWRKFKSERLMPAIAEINELTDLKIKLVERKDGRKVADVQFEIKRQQIKQGDQPNFPNMTLIEAAVAAGVAEKNAAALIKQYGDDAFAKGLEILKNYKGSTPLKSKYAYLKRCLFNGAELPEQETLFKDPVAPAINEEAPKPAEVDLLNAATKRLDALRAQFLKDLRGEPEQERRRFLINASRALEASGLKISPTERTRIDEAAITAGLLGSKALELFCLEKHGPDWKNSPLYDVAVRLP